jgi:histidinol-phosphate aminotransferase
LASLRLGEYIGTCIESLAISFRLGIALAQPPLIQVLSNTKAPYNISTPSAQLALAALSKEAVQNMRLKCQTLVESRKQLQKSLESLSVLGVGDVIGGNDANFLVVPILNKETRLPDNVRANALYTELAENKGVVVRFRGKEPGCEGCLRITIGTTEENEMLLRQLQSTLNDY